MKLSDHIKTPVTVEEFDRGWQFGCHIFNADGEHLFKVGGDKDKAHAIAEAINQQAKRERWLASKPESFFTGIDESGYCMGAFHCRKCGNVLTTNDEIDPDPENRSYIVGITGCDFCDFEKEQP